MFNEFIVRHTEAKVTCVGIVAKHHNKVNWLVLYIRQRWCYCQLLLYNETVHLRLCKSPYKRNKIVNPLTRYLVIITYKQCIQRMNAVSFLCFRCKWWPYVWIVLCLLLFDYSWEYLPWQRLVASSQSLWWISRRDAV